MICPGITPMTCNIDEDVVIAFDFAVILNIFGLSTVLIFIVFCIRDEDDDDEELLLTRISDVAFLVLPPKPLLLLLLLASILFPLRKTCNILKDSRLSSNNIKSALNPGAIAPKFFNPKYLAVLIEHI